MIYLVSPSGERVHECRGYACPAADLAEALTWWSAVEGINLTAVYFD